MKRIQARAVYIADDKITSREANWRLERLLEKIDYKDKLVIKEQHIIDAITTEKWYDRTERTGHKRNGLNVIFTTFDWDDKINNPGRKTAYEPFVQGRFAFADYRDKLQLRKDKGAVCNSGYEIHTTFGCPHSCTYCHVGNALTIMLDVEKFIEKLSVLMKNNLWQKLYKYDNQGDVLTLEPEYCATKKIVEHFSRTDKYLMLYTKSDNVDHLMNLDHKGHTLVCWTITCEEAARKYELGAPTMEERIGAARKCWVAGYGVRVRFSPIIPIKGWKEKNAEMIGQVFTNVRPEVVCLETLCHMNREQYDELFMDLEYEPQEEITEYELYSHENRREIYEFFINEIRKHDKKTRIALCLETEKMWQDLGKLLKGAPDNFYCCCGAKCV